MPKIMLSRIMRIGTPPNAALLKKNRRIANCHFYLEIHRVHFVGMQFNRNYKTGNGESSKSAVAMNSLFRTFSYALHSVCPQLSFLFLRCLESVLRKKHFAKYRFGIIVRNRERGLLFSVSVIWKFDCNLKQQLYIYVAVWEVFGYDSTVSVVGIWLISFQPLSPKLTDAERASQVSPLQESGWSLVDGRDALYKEFKFRNFNEVCSHLSFPLPNNVWCGNRCLLDNSMFFFYIPVDLTNCSL